MKVFFASDHAGFELKNNLVAWVKEVGHEAVDLGPYSFNPDDDYPDFVRLVAMEVSKDPENTRGIILGGGGQGEAMVANRLPFIRTAVFYGPVKPLTAINREGDTSDNPFEVVILARSHNDANILSLGARFVSLEDARKAVQLFLETPFSNEERHIRRIKKLN